MALRASIHKATLQISDIDRGHYEAHSLTIARHPSETDERMMVRLFAYAQHANDLLAFGKGLSTQEEPDLWEKDLTNKISLWIEVGLPTAKRLIQAAGLAESVVVYSYGQSADVWWRQTESLVTRLKNLRVVHLDTAFTQALSKQSARHIEASCMIQDSQTMWTNEDSTLFITPEIWRTENKS